MRIIVRDSNKRIRSRGKVVLFRSPGVSLASLRPSLPALISLGTTLGLALHSLLYTWDTTVIARSLVPTVSWTASRQVSFRQHRQQEDVRIITGIINL